MDQKVAKLEEHRGHADLVQEETVPGSEFGCYNLYAFVHKGLRALMADTLVQVWRILGP